MYTNPNYIAQFGATFEGLCGAFGISLANCDPATLLPIFGVSAIIGPIGATSVVPIVSIQGDRNFTDISGDQLRVVGGVRGDLPFLTMGSLDNWSFDVYASFTTSSALSERRGIREDRLDLALGVYSTTNTPCEINDPTATGPRSGLTAAQLGSDVAPGCVPVNLFDPALYPVGVVTGDFGTAAERNYVFDGRNFDTEYEQTVISGYITGEIFELPAGSVAFGFGVEHRNDDINSLPDAVARDGLFFGFFNDSGAIGDKDTDEIFAEIEFPLLAGVAGAEELTVNLSTRYTDDEVYGS